MLKMHFIIIISYCTLILTGLRIYSFSEISIFVYNYYLKLYHI